MEKFVDIAVLGLTLAVGATIGYKATNKAIDLGGKFAGKTIDASKAKINEIKAERAARQPGEQAA